MITQNMIYFGASSIVLYMKHFLNGLPHIADGQGCVLCLMHSVLAGKSECVVDIPHRPLATHTVSPPLSICNNPYSKLQ